MKEIIIIADVHYRYGHVDVSKTLVLELQADVTIKDNAGSTPLHIAAKNGHTGVVSFLLTQPGIDPVSNPMMHQNCSLYCYSCHSKKYGLILKR